MTRTKHTREGRGRYAAPTAALTAAGVMLAVSLLLPYWELELVTPSHPGGLRLVSHLSHLEGPVDTVLAIAGLEGDARLRELDELERSLGVATATVICLLVIAATFVHNRWAALLCLPALCFPAIVIADTTRWLRPIWENLAAGAAHGAPAIWLVGALSVQGTSVETHPGVGLVVAIVASMTVIVGLWLHRRAYKPLRESRLHDLGERERGQVRRGRTI